MKHTTSIHSAPFFFSLAFAVLAMTGCEPETTCKLGEKGNECDSGSVSCLNGNSVFCEEDTSGCMKWQISPTDPLKCAEKKCTDVCTAGQTKCEGNVAVSCVQDASGCMVWGMPNACATTCTNGKCDTPSQCTNECTLAQKQCRGNDVQICAPDASGCLKWMTQTTCTTTCANNACTPGDQCVNECAPTQKQCNGNVAQICAPDANGCLKWKDETTCTTSCENGECRTLQCEDQCSENEKQCNGKTIQTCQTGESGCLEWVDEYTCTSSCTNGECGACQNACEDGKKRCLGTKPQTCEKMPLDKCTKWVTGESCPGACILGECEKCLIKCDPGSFRCSGKSLEQCVINNSDCPSWESVKTCKNTCLADVGSCTDDLPLCEMKPGMEGTILQWTDGDTLWIRAKETDTCTNSEIDKETGLRKYVRFDIRIEGIDAPECSKDRNENQYYTCIKDTKYTPTNERYGYESWQAAEKLLPYGSLITVSCEKTMKDGTCDFDTTDNRRLAYIGYSRNNTSYDFSTEMARMGMAFANVEFANTTSLIGQICKAQDEAIKSKAGVWSLGNTVNDVLKMMSNAKQNNLRNLESRCNALMK